MAGFTNEERVFFNALVQMSKSIEKIAVELSQIKSLLQKSQRQEKLAESRQRGVKAVEKLISEGKIPSSSRTDDDIMAQIRKIRGESPEQQGFREGKRMETPSLV